MQGLKAKSTGNGWPVEDLLYDAPPMEIALAPREPRHGRRGAVWLGLAILCLMATQACRGRPQFAQSEKSDPEPDEQIVVNEPFPDLPDAPSTSGRLLLEPAQEEDCIAACRRLLELEVSQIKADVDEHLAEGTQSQDLEAMEEDLSQLFADLVAGRIPACIERCRKSFSRGVTECLRLTGDVAAAVDCLARSGAAGD